MQLMRKSKVVGRFQRLTQLEDYALEHGVISVWVSAAKDGESGNARILFLNGNTVDIGFDCVASVVAWINARPAWPEIRFV